jgi:hypothetical protein
MGFEPSTFCMASSCSAPEIVPKCLQIGGIQRALRQDGFQELRRNTGGLDKERTMRTKLLPLTTWAHNPKVARSNPGPPH